MVWVQHVLQPMRVLFSLCDIEGTRVDLVMLGPLTNLALALRLYPDIANALGCVYIMGGATDAAGA